ncbi:MAG: helix-turn-helix domain-containing protein [Phenylobacterium sp.]|nr:helix-turn-helix domain-containing protein [Phenylobacterium sp.]
MPIGRLAKATDVKITTIRFYEEIGLLPQATRTEGNRRVYGDETLRRLAFIKHARQLGFSVEAIRDLLDLAAHPDQPCVDANRLAEGHLAVVEEKIAQLSALKSELQRMLANGCDGPVADCRVIEVLSDHSLCAHDHAGAPGHL